MIICPITPQVCDVHAVTGLLPIKSEPPRSGSIPRWAASNGCPSIANEKCPHLDAVNFYSMCLLQQLYHRLTTLGEPADNTDRAIFVCLLKSHLTMWVSVGFLACGVNTTNGTCVVSREWMIHDLSSSVCVKTIILWKCLWVRGEDLIIVRCVASLKEHTYSCWEQNSPALSNIILWNNVRQAVRRKMILRSWTAWQVCLSVTCPHIESDSVREEHMPLSCRATLPLALIY